MSATTVIDRLAASQARIEGTLGGGPLWTRRRASALATIVDRGLPDRRDENWKYLDHARLAEYAAEPAAGVAPDPAALAGRLLPLDATRLVLVDGRLDAQLSDPPPEGVEPVDLRRLLDDDPAAALAMLRTPGEDADDRYALLADAFTDRGVVIRVAPGATLARPVYLVHVSTALVPATLHARLALVIGAGAKLTIIEHFVATGPAASLGNVAAELTMAPGAELTHLRLHEHGAEAALVENWVARLGESSRYGQHFLALGGRLLRSDLLLRLDGRGASCRLSGLLLADRDRQVDVHTRIVHAAPATDTWQEFRGVAGDRGRAAFNGRIVVEAGARGANAEQSSRNLLLSPLAEINARPQLEIHVDDVQCRHGATTGTHDESQVFYLRSRGLDEPTARALLTWAFCRDVLARVPVPEAADRAQSHVAGMLPDRDLIRGIA